MAQRQDEAYVWGAPTDNCKRQPVKMELGESGVVWLKRNVFATFNGAGFPVSPIGRNSCR